jgi:hypothetical protein
MNYHKLIQCLYCVEPSEQLVPTAFLPGRDKPRTSRAHREPIMRLAVTADRAPMILGQLQQPCAPNIGRPSERQLTNQLRAAPISTKLPGFQRLEHVRDVSILQLMSVGSVYKNGQSVGWKLTRPLSTSNDLRAQLEESTSLSNFNRPGAQTVYDPVFWILDRVGWRRIPALGYHVYLYYLRSAAFSHKRDRSSGGNASCSRPYSQAIH